MFALIALAAAMCPSNPEHVVRSAERAVGTGLGAGDVVRDAECLGAPLPSEGARVLHQAAAIDRFLADDLQGTLAHLRATPGWEPTDPALARLASAHAVATPVTRSEPVVIPEGWLAMVDGLAARSRPTDRAVFFQWVAPDGTARRSSLLLPGDPLPGVPLAAPGLAALATREPWIDARGNRVLVGGVALGTAGLVMLVAGLGVGASLPDGTPAGADPAFARDVRRTRTTANALGWAGQGLGLAGAGVVVASRVAFR